MSTKAGDVLSERVSFWDTAKSKEVMDEFVDQASNTSRESTKTGLSTLIPLFFSSVFSALKFPLTIATTVGGFLAEKVMPAADASVDASAKSSSNVAKRSIHATIDTSAASSNWTWSWFN